MSQWQAKSCKAIPSGELHTELTHSGSVYCKRNASYCCNICCLSYFFSFVFVYFMNPHYFRLRLIIHERSKRGVWNAQQNAWQRQPKFQMRKYIKTRSNLDERFWRLQYGVSSASSVSNAAGGVVNARARNAVQSTRKRFIRLSQLGVCARCSMLCR